MHASKINSTHARALMIASLVLLASVGWAGTCPTTGSVIDDFTTGPVPATTLQQINQNASVDFVQLATGVPGSARRVILAASGNPFGQAATVSSVSNPDDPNGGHVLVLSSGVEQYPGLQVMYGYDANKNYVPLHYHPAAGCDRIRVTFDSNSRDLLAITELTLPTSTSAYTSEAALPAGNNARCVDFVFSKFKMGNTALTQDVSQTGIDFILLELETASSIGANDFAIKRIELADSSLGPVGACIVAP